MNADKRAIFNDPELQSLFEEQGYIVVPFFSPDEVKAMTDHYHALPKVQDDGFFSSLYVPEEAFKRQSHQVLETAGRKVTDHFLKEYDPLIGNFVTKKTGPNSTMPPHQDWTFVDEKQFTSINIWCPLVDVTHKNGAIYILKGCHKMNFTIRGTQIPHAFQQVTGMNYETLTYLPMKAGEVLLYDHKMIHASPPNTTDQVRIAAAWATVPREAQVLHFKQSEQDGKLEKYAASHDFFMQYTFGSDTIPEQTQLMDVVEYDLPMFSEEEVARMYVPQKPGGKSAGLLDRITKSFRKLVGA